MSQATKRKHVAKEVLGEHVVPAAHQQIVRVLRTPGNNLHEVETARGQRFLVSMPSKYRKHIWIKRGDFLIVDPIEEGEKVKAEISFVLCRDHVRALQKDGIWPKAFSEVVEKQDDRRRQTREELPAEPPQSGDDSSSADDTDLFINTNRPQYEESEEEEEESEDGEEEEEEEKAAAV